MPSITPRSVSQAMIAAAIVEYMNTHPLPGGLPPSNEQVAMAVAEYMASNPVPAGKAGRDADPAPAPTLEQIRAAVDAFMAEYPPLKGDPGKDATPSMVSSAVSDWFAANPVQTVKGDPGAGASDGQVATAVGAWLSANPPASGKDGKSVEIRASAGYIQGRQVGSPWENIVALSDFTGPAGASVEMQKTSEAIQWRREGGAWSNLLLLSDIQGAPGLKGDKGDKGNTGDKGEPGLSVKGDKGEKGSDGLSIKGDPGTAATVSVGAVTKLAAGANPTVANTGSPSAAVLAFGLPSGLQGVSLGTATLTQTAIIAITGGMRTLTVTGVSGLVPADNVLLFPTAALPDGVSILDAWCSANGTLKASLMVPVLAVGQSYSINVRVIVLR